MSPVDPLYSSPDYYRLLFDERTDDVAFYRSLATGTDEVLEYGIGTGRVAIPLAQSGRRVLGVDNAHAMLEQLAVQLRELPRPIAERVTFVREDVLTFRAGRRFDLIICPFNGLAHFESNEQLASLFEAVRQHLAPSGRFAFDIWLPNPGLLAGSSTQTPWTVHPKTGRRVRCTERFDYLPIEQILRARIDVVHDDVDGPLTSLELRLRQFFPLETLGILERHGFELLWRTDCFEPPPPDLDTAQIRPASSDQLRGEMLAYVCRLRQFDRP